MAKEPKTLQEAILYFANPDNCIAYLVERRWPDGNVKCPNCGRDGAVYMPARRVWQCKTRHSKSQFSIKVGTIMEDSALGLDKWLTAMWMVASCKNGVSSWEIHRALGIGQKAAWFVLHRIRLTMKDERTHKFGNDGTPVESDEAFIGPLPQRMHKDRRVKVHAAGRYSNKVSIHGLLDRELRQVRATVVPNVKRETLQNLILDNVTTGAKLYTDLAVAYNGFENEFIHEVVDHSREYVRGEVSTQGLENFWSLLKRGLRGTYIAVEPFHLHRYLDEQLFRYNNRATKDNPLTDADRFTLAVTQIVGKRLTYAELTGKEKGSTEATPF
jgi:hypothetical protein